MLHEAHTMAAMPSSAQPLIASGGELGALLRRWRGLRGRSQLDVSTDTGVSQRHISFIESGRSVPSRRNVDVASHENADVHARINDNLRLTRRGNISAHNDMTATVVERGLKLRECRHGYRSKGAGAGRCRITAGSGGDSKREHEKCRAQEKRAEKREGSSFHFF